MIHARGLTKTFKTRTGPVEAVRGVDLDVEAGELVGVLGPNGAGKTTAIRILTTILVPDGGRAEVLGLDVVRQAEEVRYRIGLAGQYAAIDPNLTGRENLRLTGRLAQLPTADARTRAEEGLPMTMVVVVDRLHFFDLDSGLAIRVGDGSRA